MAGPHDRPRRGGPVTVPAVELRAPVAAMANVAFWALAHSLSGYVAYRLPASLLEHDGPLLRLKRFERGGRLYEGTLRIRRWKDRLPEAGALFPGGLSKRSLPCHRDGGVERFVIETRRAELAHWMSLAPLPLCALWNPPIGLGLMTVYGFVANAPFILVQRYSRGRAQRVIDRRVERSNGSRSDAVDRGVERTHGRSIP